MGRRRILEAALELADGEGLDAVTMRRVAGRLGAGTMSLYHHVPNKEALLAGMADLLFERVDLSPRDEQGWTDRIVRLNLSFRRVVVGHPALMSVISSGRFGGPAVLRVTEAFFDALRQGGFGPEEAAHVYRAVASYVIGYLSLELGGFFGSVVGDSRRLVRSHRPDEYPRLSEVSDHLRAWDPQPEFEAGMRRLLAGFDEDLA